jgi:histidine kinase
MGPCISGNGYNVLNMRVLIYKLRHSLITKLLLSVGGILLLSLSLWGYSHVSYVEDKSMGDLTGNVDRLSNTIRLGLHYAMMLNSRDDIQQTINNIARQNDIENIRIYNKLGEIKYSNHPNEVDQMTNIKAEACYICHNTEPPTTHLALPQRVRIFQSPAGYRLMGIISPVYNEVGCATDCHVHPIGKQVLGALDLVVSLKEVDREITSHQRTWIILGVVVFVATAAMVIFLVVRFVTIPIGKLIQWARQVEEGDVDHAISIHQNDEIRELSEAINRMRHAIGEKNAELDQQRKEYQSLFEMVPCIITVQNRDYRLIGFNREFAEEFAPRIGDHCYRVYKGRTEKCIVCPVEKTFADGRSHYSEESGIDKDGTVKHWIVRTSPIKDADGRIVAAMEMNLDITQRKQLEEKLEQSEKKYHDIFNNIPNPVFVLDPATFTILDCNNSVSTVYEHARNELLGTCFLDLFWDSRHGNHADSLKKDTVIERAKHRSKTGQQRYVTVRVSPSEYGGLQVLLVTISDITKRLEAEQQLIQASKMATLGEMATGVAHELNQPLSVIKTASNFFMRKIRQKEPIRDDILYTMAEEVDSHVQRAAKIINHMRQFGRKSDDLDLTLVQLNDILQQAFEIFSQQLKVRGIEVIWQIDPQLPKIMADAGRLEQVLINLLINARDAIEDRWEHAPDETAVRQIRLTSFREDSRAVVQVCDSGAGVPEGYADKIFEPFFTTKKVGQGTGLGLSISYGIVKECHGNIHVEPNSGGGACFVIEFPIPEGG